MMRVCRKFVGDIDISGINTCKLGVGVCVRSRIEISKNPIHTQPCAWKIT